MAQAANAIRGVHFIPPPLTPTQSDAVSFLGFRVHFTIRPLRIWTFIMRSAYCKAYGADVFYARACYLKKINPMQRTREQLLNGQGAEVVSRSPLNGLIAAIRPLTTCHQTLRISIASYVQKSTKRVFEKPTPFSVGSTIAIDSSGPPAYQKWIRDQAAWPLLAKQ